MNKQQGTMNFEIRFQKSQQKEPLQNIQKLVLLVDKAQPKREFKSKKLVSMGLHDPKRIHSCLREFNDLSATRIFNAISQEMSIMLKADEREKLKKDSDFT